MKKLQYILVSASILAAVTACKTTSTSSGVKASVNQSIEEKWSYIVDLTKEINFVFDIGVGDKLTASRGRVDNVQIGAKINPVFSFGGLTLFRIAPSIEIKNLYERRVLTEIQLVREKDVNGDGDGEGLFVDADTVAMNRLVNCRAQKVITQDFTYAKTQGGAINFTSLSLGASKVTNTKMTASTDYVMSRGFYRLKSNVPVTDLLNLCADIAASDVALQSLSTINETIQMNFDNQARFMQIADDVAAGKKVNNFQFHNQKFDFRIRARENGKIFYEVFPDTGYADPKLDIEVRYSMYGSTPQVDDIIQNCVSNCQNYIDSNGKHGLHGYGEAATKEQNQEYIKILSSIFTARVLGSR